MSSQIDVSKPASGAATTQSVRDNFTQAVADLKALQGESGILSIAASVASNALTVALKTSAGANATSTTGIEVSFRNATAATGTRTAVSTTGAVSVVVPQGATLGFANSGIEFIYVYGINNSGTLEIGLSGSIKDDNTLQTSVALSATSDLDATLYSTTARTTVPIRYLGRIRVQTGSTAGDWSIAPSEISSVTQYPPASGFLTSSDIGSTIQAYDATIMVDADIGATVQGYDADTSKTDVAETRSASINMADQIVQRPVFKDYAETKVAMAANAVDLSLGNVQTKTISGAQTLTFSNPPASGSAGSFTLILTNGGSATVTWPTSVDWPAATAPTLTAAGVDVLVFTTIDGGTIWYGMAVVGMG